MTIEDQTLPVKICIDGVKYNKIKPEVNNTGYGGWDQGEIRLIGKPDDWKSKKEKEWERQASSSKRQASSIRQLRLTSDKLIGYYKRNK